MNTNYSLLFYLKKPKNYVNGPKPIYMRITVAGVPRELSAGRECDPIRWNPISNRVKGLKEEIRNLNAHLDTLERKIEDVHVQLVKQEIDISAEILMSKYQGKDVVRRLLMEVFEEHNAKMEALLGKGFQPNTLKGYKTSVSHLTEYLLKDYRAKDIDIRNIDHAFITGYEFFLRSVKECSDVSAAKYMKHFERSSTCALPTAGLWKIHSSFTRIQPSQRKRNSSPRMNWIGLQANSLIFIDWHMYGTSLCFVAILACPMPM